MRYKKGSTVIVYEGSKRVYSFELEMDMKCLDSIRKMVYTDYKHLKQNEVTLRVE